MTAGIRAARGGQNILERNTEQEWQFSAPGRATLVWMLPPRVLRALG
jgi:hypothetical protein